MKGITEGVSRLSKKELLDLATSPRCDPEQEQFCPKKQFCDTRNNVCLKEKPKHLKEIEINGNKIIGYQDDLTKLVKLFENKKQQEEIPPISLYEETKEMLPLEETKEMLPLEETKEMLPLEETKEMLPLSKPQTLLENEDIENVLKEIEEDSDYKDEIIKISQVQEMVFKCLGLLP